MKLYVNCGRNNSTKIATVAIASDFIKVLVVPNPAKIIEMNAYRCSMSISFFPMDSKILTTTYRVLMLLSRTATTISGRKC